MRPTQQKNRSRGRGNRKSGGGGGNIVNRVYDSAGPEGKVRGTPQQIIDKYLSLARDSQTSGDRVMSENFLQHAEHYQRMLMQANAAQEQSRREQTDTGDYDGDGPEPAQGERRVQNQRHDTRADEHGGNESGADEIGGMTTIDAGRDDADLLVASEDIERSQPRRNGDGRRRRPRQSEDAGQDDTAHADERPQAQGEN